MTQEFNLISNLPLIILGVLFFAVFVLFLRALIVLLMAKGDPVKIETGRGHLANAFLGFFVVLLVVFVFYLISFLLKKGEALQPQPASGEFPASPSANFPAPPKYLNLGGYYFNGPLLLTEKNITQKAAVYSVLCKQNEIYDIIYIDSIGDREGKAIFKNSQYNCWQKKCGSGKNLYFAAIYTPKTTYDLAKINGLKEDLNNLFNPSCRVIQENNQ